MMKSIDPKTLIGMSVVDAKTKVRLAGRDIRTYVESGGEQVDSSYVLGRISIVSNDQHKVVHAFEDEPREPRNAIKVELSE